MNLTACMSISGESVFRNAAATGFASTMAAAVITVIDAYAVFTDMTRVRVRPFLSSSP